MAVDTLTILPPVEECDSVLSDSISGPVPGEELQGIMLTDPLASYRTEFQPTHDDSESFGMSWVYVALSILFCIIGLKFKGSTKFLSTIVSDMTDTRLRHNAFDDTVKETSLIVLLNVMWVACAGILMWLTVKTLQGNHTASDSVGVVYGQAAGIGICMAVAAAYLLLMLVAYWVVGNVFSDAALTSLWIKGAAASTGLQAFLLFPIALVALNYPAWCVALLIAAAVVFILGKIVFLFQGFRIFFTQIASWLLFLYYLCSLEIIRVVLTYVATLQICSSGL